MTNNADSSAQLTRFDLLGYLRKPSRSRKILIWCAVVAIVIAAILVVAPIAVARYVEDWLRDNGATSARVQDVDINLFTGVVRVSGLDAGDGPRSRLSIGSAELNVQWWPLVSQRIHVQSLRLADAQVDLVAGEAQRWQIGAVKIQPSAQEASATEVEIPAGGTFPWGFGSEIVHITNMVVTYRDSNFDTEVNLRELLVGGQFTWDAGRTTEVVLDVSIDGAPLVLRSDVLPWAEDRRFKGALTLSDLNLADYQQTLQDLSGLVEPRGSISLDLDVSASYGADGVLELLIAGPLELENAEFTLDNLTVANQSLRWKGDVALELPAPEDGSLLRVEGVLQLSGSRAALANLELVAELGSLGWNGSVGFSPARAEGSAPEVVVRSQVTGRGFNLEHAGLPFMLAALEEFDATDVQVDGLALSSVQQMRLRGLRLLGERADGVAQKPDVLTVEQLEMNDIGFDSQGGMSVRSLMLRGPAASLVRNEQGEFERISAVMAAFADDGGPDDGATDTVEPAQSTVDSAAPMRVTVADLQVRAEALLSFLDNSVNPTARLKLSDMEIGISNLDSTGDKSMNVHLVTGDGSMKLTADGTVNAFAEAPFADVAVELISLDLPQISPYLPGYNIERGRLSTNSKVAVNEGTLEVTNALLIERLKLSGKAAEGSDMLSQGMAMPLDVALDLLRDGNDRIKLDLPISGTLADPKFGTGDIIRTAMQKSLQNAAMSYVKNALQPLGTLLLVGNLATKATRPRFAPVQMAPGDSSLSAAAREYLEKLRALLRARPGLQLTICGVASPADREALTGVAISQAAPDEEPKVSDAKPEASEARTEAEAPLVTDAELLQLASLRTSAVIGFLAEKEKMLRDRLFNCRETIEQSADEGPRVDISL